MDNKSDTNKSIDQSFRIYTWNGITFLKKASIICTIWSMLNQL